MKKPKIVFNTDFCRAKTGFGRFSKEVLKHLHSTGKYDIVELACGVIANTPELGTVPWKAIGTYLDEPGILERLGREGHAAKSQMNYGYSVIEKLMAEEKPDLYIGVNDIWAFPGFIRMPWWTQTRTIISATIDSLPMIDIAYEVARASNRFFVWSSFAEKAMKESGFDGVSTLHGPINTSVFRKLPDEYRAALRAHHNIDQKSEIIGFVFRNQLRKSVPQLFEAFAKIQDLRPNAKLLLHATLIEQDGWHIPSLMNQFKLDPSRVLMTYICKKCGKYSIIPMSGEEVNCPKCGADKSMITTRTGFGVSDEEMNEIYNLMDVYCHPFTSGGQEMPLQEAKLAGLVTLCPSYSCGADSCYQHQGGLPLDWSPYYEPNSQFMKATTHPESIAENILKVLTMDKADKDVLTKAGREYVENEYSSEIIGRRWEQVIDEVLKEPGSVVPLVTADLDFIPDNNLDDEDWAVSVLTRICGVPEKDTPKFGLNEIIKDLSSGRTREAILSRIKANVSEQMASRAKKDENEWAKILSNSDKERVAVIMPESAGDVFMATSLLPNIAKMYPRASIYFITKAVFADILKGNPHVKAVIPWDQRFDNQLWLTGAGDHKGWFDVALLLHSDTQRVLNYINNGKFNSQFNLF